MAQLQRISSAAKGRRKVRAEMAASKYIRNIASMKRFASDLYNRGLASARTRSYSAGTYMYGNNGG